MSLIDDDDRDDDEQSGPIVRPLSKKKQEKFTAEAERAGVVYLSRIPPYMQPQKLRFMLEQYGETRRLFLTPEDAAIARKRKKMTKKSRKHFTEGWVEFADKKIAKAVASTLNNTSIGGKKAGFYHDDVWNIKYLKGFKWTHLTEQISYDKAVREQKVRNEMSQAKKEEEFYLERVKQGQAIQAMEKKGKRRAQSEADEEADGIRSFLGTASNEAKRPRRLLDDPEADDDRAPSASSSKQSKAATPFSTAEPSSEHGKILRTFRQSAFSKYHAVCCLLFTLIDSHHAPIGAFLDFSFTFCVYSLLTVIFIDQNPLSIVILPTRSSTFRFFPRYFANSRFEFLFVSKSALTLTQFMLRVSPCQVLGR
jgi:ESF2/ABP1 family protein